MEEIFEKKARLASTLSWLLENEKETLFMREFGLNSVFIEEIFNFLRAFRTVGHLYRIRLKIELENAIRLKASKIGKSKQDIEKIRDDLFHIMVRHGYLVECHPKDVIFTAYKVGPQFGKKRGIGDMEALIESFAKLSQKFYCPYKEQEVSVLNSCLNCIRFTETMGICEYNQNI